MALSQETIQSLKEEYDRILARRGNEYDRWYGLLTADLEYLEWVMENPEWRDDEDYEIMDVGPEAYTMATDWLEDFYWQVLDEVYECNTEEKFLSKFTTTCSLAWLYYWDVLHWEEYVNSFVHLKELNDERDDGDEQPLPQWIQDKMAEWEV